MKLSLIKISFNDNNWMARCKNMLSDFFEKNELSKFFD